MSGPAFTRGPWRAGIEADWRPLASEDRDELCTLPHHTFDAVDVFSCPRGDDYEEHKANANLIAAAPELYEAAEAFLRAWCDGQTRESAAHLAIELGRALRKARGDQ